MNLWSGGASGGDGLSASVGDGAGTSADDYLGGGDGQMGLGSSGGSLTTTPVLTMNQPGVLLTEGLQRIRDRVGAIHGAAAVEVLAVVS